MHTFFKMRFSWVTVLVMALATVAATRLNLSWWPGSMGQVPHGFPLDWSVFVLHRWWALSVDALVALAFVLGLGILIERLAGRILATVKMRFNCISVLAIMLMTAAAAALNLIFWTHTSSRGIPFRWHQMVSMVIEQFYWWRLVWDIFLAVAVVAGFGITIERLLQRKSGSHRNTGNSHYAA